MATAAQIAANRRNALLARGPKTAQGKEIARSNSLKHGLTGAGVVMLPEDREKYERRRADWAEGLGVVDDAGQFLADRAALASVRLDRCVTVESARLAERASDAEKAFDRRERRRARALGARLHDDPAAVAARLRGSAAGCRWMIGQLGELMERLEGAEPLDEASRLRCQHLLAGDVAWLADFHDDPEARRELRGSIDAEVMVLEILRDRFAAEVEGPAREHARTLALFDPSDEAARLAKYEASHESTLHRTLKALDRRPRTRAIPETDPEAEIEAEILENEPDLAPVGAQNEPNPAPMRVVPRPSRQARGPSPRRLAIVLAVGLLAGLLLGAPGRLNDLRDRVFGLNDGAAARPASLADGDRGLAGDEAGPAATGGQGAIGLERPGEPADAGRRRAARGAATGPGA